DRFLSHLIHTGAQAFDFTVVTLGRYLQDHQPTRDVALRVPSAWSCAHGVARWSTGCTCTEGDAGWKPTLRQALDRLAARLDDVFERVGSETLRDPWAARDAYIGLHHRWLSAEEYWVQHGRGAEMPLSAVARRRAEQLLEAQYWGQA